MSEDDDPVRRRRPDREPAGDQPPESESIGGGPADNEPVTDVDSVRRPARRPPRDRQRLAYELDELLDNAQELRDELNALQTGSAGASQDRAQGSEQDPEDETAEDTAGGDGRPGASAPRAAEGPSGNPPSVAELHERLYRESAGVDDPGGDVVALLRLTSEHSAALQDLEVRKPVLPCWAEMDREQATKAWEQLVDWLCGVLIVRYPTSARTLRPCWYLHPELVENLSWLHNAWTVAYRDGSSSISMAADWHLLWLPHVMTVAGEATRKCYDAGRHDPSSDRDLTADNAVGISEDLTAHVRADLLNRPDPEDPNPRGYVVPPARPVASPPWSSYRRDSPTPTAGPGPGPGPGPGQTYPTPPGPGRSRGAGPNPYQPR